jgi:hypothetical protein
VIPDSGSRDTFGAGNYQNHNRVGCSPLRDQQQFICFLVMTKICQKFVGAGKRKSFL